MTRVSGVLVWLTLLDGCAMKVDAVPPRIDASVALPITEADIARACLLANGCGTAPPVTLGRCVVHLTRRALDPRGTGEDLWDRLLECSSRPATASTCEAFSNCVTRGHPASYCAQHPGDSCDGAIAVHCPGAGAPATTEDCGTIPGGRCSAYGADPTTAFCEGPCVPVCAGPGAVVLCNGTLGQRANRCTAGMSCVTGTFFTNTVGSCLPPGPSCDALASRCEGTTLVRCGGDFIHRETRSDCARLGWRCTLDDEGNHCDAPIFACDLDAPPACEGDALVVCSPGASRFDCRALGFARCAPASATRPARCEP